MLNHLSNEVIAIILSNWIGSLEVISALDIALCNVQLRRTYLNAVQFYALTAPMDYIITPPDNALRKLEWIKERKIKCASYKLSVDTLDHWKAFTRVVDCNILTTLNLQSFHHCWDIDFNTIMETFPSLKILHLSNMFHDRLSVTTGDDDIFLRRPSSSALEQLCLEHVITTYESWKALFHYLRKHCAACLTCLRLNDCFDLSIDVITMINSHHFPVLHTLEYIHFEVNAPYAIYETPKREEEVEENNRVPLYVTVSYEELLNRITTTSITFYQCNQITHLTLQLPCASNSLVDNSQDEISQEEKDKVLNIQIQYHQLCMQYLCCFPCLQQLNLSNISSSFDVDDDEKIEYSFFLHLITKHWKYLRSLTLNHCSSFLSPPIFRILTQTTSNSLTVLHITVPNNIQEVFVVDKTFVNSLSCCKKLQSFVCTNGYLVKDGLQRLLLHTRSRALEDEEDETEGQDEDEYNEEDADDDNDMMNDEIIEDRDKTGGEQAFAHLNSFRVTNSRRITVALYLQLFEMIPLTYIELQARQIIDEQYSHGLFLPHNEYNQQPAVVFKKKLDLLHYLLSTDYSFKEVTESLNIEWEETSQLHLSNKNNDTVHGDENSQFQYAATFSRYEKSWLFSFPSLRHLTLTHFPVTTIIFQNIVQYCPVLTTLQIACCEGSFVELDKVIANIRKFTNTKKLMILSKLTTFHFKPSGVVHSNPLKLRNMSTLQQWIEICPLLCDIKLFAVEFIGKDQLDGAFHSLQNIKYFLKKQYQYRIDTFELAGRIKKFA